MATRSILIVGCGYLGKRVAPILIGQGARVLGTTRSSEKARVLERLGIEPVIADLGSPRSLDPIAPVDHTLYCVGFDRSTPGDVRDRYVEGLKSALDVMGSKTRSLVYVSSTGVFGGDDGGWVTERSPTDPTTDSGRACVEAEAMVDRWGKDRGIAATSLRLAGLYGPGRVIRREGLLRGEAIVGDPEKFLNMIAIDDAAAICAEALVEPPSEPLVLVSDGRPTTRREFYGVVAELLGVAPPTFEAPSGEGPRRGESNKRVDNGLMTRTFRTSPRYPDVRAGLAAALAEEARA